MNWAQCREPYKSEIDAITSLWIEGTLSNESLAFEAVQLMSQLNWTSQPDPASRVIRMDDVFQCIQILMEAMLAVSEHPPESQSSDLRRQMLDSMRMELAGSQKGIR
ncbi:MAG: hypothetical protein Q8K78_11055 [Planctomycetaceae bacterium]|nr:hypothetical protein [Planctomycetaceae bacterium]